MLKTVAMSNEIPRSIWNKNFNRIPVLSIYGAGLAKKMINMADKIPDILPKWLWKWSGIETRPLARIFGAIKKAYIVAKI